MCSTYRKIWNPPPMKPIVAPTSEPMMAPIPTTHVSKNLIAYAWKARTAVAEPAAQ